MNRLHMRASKHGVQAWEFIFQRQKHKPSFRDYNFLFIVKVVVVLLIVYGIQRGCLT